MESATPSSSLGRHSGLSFGRSSQEKQHATRFIALNPLTSGQLILAFEITFQCGYTLDSVKSRSLSDTRKALRRADGLGVWKSSIRELYRMEIFHIARGDFKGVGTRKSSLARAGAHSLVSQRDLDAVISGDRKAVLDVRQGCILFSLAGHRAIITSNRALVFLEEGADESVSHLKELVATQMLRWNEYSQAIIKREIAFEKAAADEQVHEQPSSPRSPDPRRTNEMPQIPAHVGDDVLKGVELYFQSIVVSSEPSFEFLVLTTLIKAVEERLLRNLNSLDAQVQQVLRNKGATDVETQALQDIQEQVTSFHSSLESATGEIVDILEDEEDLDGLVLSQTKMLNVDPIELSKEVLIAAEADLSDSEGSFTNAVATGISTESGVGLHHERSIPIGDLSVMRDHLHLHLAAEHSSSLASRVKEMGFTQGMVVAILNPLYSHDSVIAEELLEWIKGNIDAFSLKSRNLISQIEGAHKNMTLRLASNRNELMLLQLDLQTITMGLAVCSMVSGYLGMNLGNGACGPDGCDENITTNHGYSYFLAVVILSISIAATLASVMFTLSRTKSGNSTGILERCQSRNCFRRRGS